MPDHERHQQSAAVPEQFTECQHRHHAGQPDLDGVDRVDEGTADQRADPALAQVMQIGTGPPDDLRLELRPEME